MIAITVLTALASLALALPQDPTGTAPMAGSPESIGPPPPVFAGFPFPDLSKLAHNMGFDPAKATPDPMG